VKPEKSPELSHCNSLRTGNLSGNSQKSQELFAFRMERKPPLGRPKIARA
jgi:hypothetical protein